MGVSLCTYSGPIDVSDPNEALVYAMLVGCQELKWLGGYVACIEGGILSLLFGGGQVKILTLGD